MGNNYPPKDPLESWADYKSRLLNDPVRFPNKLIGGDEWSKEDIEKAFSKEKILAGSNPFPSPTSES